MDWFFNLLEISCPFCLSPLGWAAVACEYCAFELIELKQKDPIRVSLPGSTKVVHALSLNEAWLKNLILTQKKHPMREALHFLSEAIHEKILAQFDPTLPLVGVPGKAYDDLHLVERILLSLNHQFNWPVLHKRLLSRRFHFLPQKAKNRPDRIDEESNLKRFKALKHSWCPKKVILFDDVITTGSTLLACKKILEAEFQIEVQALICIAHTPKQFSPVRPSNQFSFESSGAPL